MSGECATQEKQGITMTSPEKKGYVFEAIVRAILADNGWKLMTKGEASKYRCHSRYNIELRGRGTWHQIDSPCLYRQQIPFLYPLRLIVEAKCFKKVIYKSHIRSFIGVIKDISENYFVNSDAPEELGDRYCDIGAFFSASGFNHKAVNLAFAHGIKTISYKTNPPMRTIMELIQKLESVGYPDKATIDAAGGRQGFMHDLEYFLRKNTNRNDARPILNNGITDTTNKILQELQQAVRSIQTSLIGTTASGVLLHFLGTDAFPSELFESTDTQHCRIYYNQQNQTEIAMWLEFSEDQERRRFYFDVPPGLEKIIVSGGNVVNAKEQTFPSIQVYREINGIFRCLNFTIDREWIEKLRRREVR